MTTVQTWAGIPNTFDGLLAAFSEDDCGNIICAINVLIDAFKEITGERNLLEYYNGHFLLSKLANYNLNDYLIWNSDTEDLTIRNLREYLLPDVTELPPTMRSQVVGNAGGNADYPDGLIILYKPEKEQYYKCYKICTTLDEWYKFCYNDDLPKTKVKDLDNPKEINKFFSDATDPELSVPQPFNITLTQVGIIQPPTYYDASKREAYKTEKERPVGQIVLNIGDPKIRESMYIIPKDIVDNLSSSEITLDHLNFRTNWFNNGPIGDFDGLEKWRSAYQLITRQLFFGSYSKHGRLTSQLTLELPTPAEYNNDNGTEWEKWCCSICGREIHGASKVKGYDVDHVFNLIFNTYFEVNDKPLGFLNACGGCNKWKSESIWVPNENVWDGLKNKSKYKNNNEQKYVWPMMREGQIVNKLWKTGDVDAGDRHLQSGMSNTNITRSQDEPCMENANYVLQYYYLSRLDTILKTTKNGKEILEACKNDDIGPVKKKIVNVYERFSAIAQLMVSEGRVTQEVYNAIFRGQLNEDFAQEFGVDEEMEKKIVASELKRQDEEVTEAIGKARTTGENVKKKGIVPGGIRNTHTWSLGQTSQRRELGVTSSQGYNENSSPLGTQTTYGVIDEELEQARKEIFSKKPVIEIVAALMDKNTLWGTILSSNPWRDFYSFLGYQYKTQPPLGMDERGTRNKRRLWDMSRSRRGEEPSPGGRGGLDLARLKETIIPHLKNLTKINAIAIEKFLAKNGGKKQVQEVGNQLQLNSGDGWTQDDGYPPLERPVYNSINPEINELYNRMCGDYEYRHNQYYFMENFVLGLDARAIARERLMSGNKTYARIPQSPKTAPPKKPAKYKDGWVGPWFSKTKRALYWYNEVTGKSVWVEPEREESSDSDGEESSDSDGDVKNPPQVPRISLKTKMKNEFPEGSSGGDDRNRSTATSNFPNPTLDYKRKAEEQEQLLSREEKKKLWQDKKRRLQQKRTAASEKEGTAASVKERGTCLICGEITRQGQDLMCDDCKTKFPNWEGGKKKKRKKSTKKRRRRKKKTRKRRRKKKRTKKKRRKIKKRTRRMR